jgi:GWxTD domain-containing protein
MSITTKLLLLIPIIAISSVLAKPTFIPVMLDYTFYKSQDSKNYMEVYLSIFQNSLSYISGDNGLTATYTASVKIEQNDTIVKKQTKKIQSTINSLSEIRPDKQFVNIFGFELPQGKYGLKVVVEDENMKNRGEYQCEFNSVAFPSDSLAMSEIELASSITRAVEGSEFNKNTLCVIPNPSNTYNVTMPMIYYYAEIYNLPFNEADPGEYIMKSYLTDKNDNVIKKLPDKIQTVPGKSAVLVNGLNIVTLPTDIYFLNVEVQDKTTNQTTKRQKRFAFQKPEPIDTSAQDLIAIDDSKSNIDLVYTGMSETEMNQEFEMVKYIAKSEEKEIFKSLNTEGKKSFLTNFWKRRNKKYPEFSGNFKEDYFERINSANTYFSAGKIAGWKTDRGRVLLTYGNPNELDRYYMEVDKKPYEIWTYHNLEGGVIFIFADLQGFGDFELIHSTYSQELRNPDWERLVKRAESTSTSDFFDMR